MRALSIAFASVAALGLAGCFNPTEPDCSFRCSPHKECPEDYSCHVDDGLCHRNGTPDGAVCPVTGTQDLLSGGDARPVADGGPDLTGGPDLLGAPDLLGGGDLAMPDGGVDAPVSDDGGADLLAVDMTATADSATDDAGVDMTLVPDLTDTGDMTVVPDLLVVPDLTDTRDMTVIPDMTVVPDLLPAGSHVVMVGQGGFTFAPPSLTIPAGDTVVWIWASGPHSVTSGNTSSCTADGTFCSPNDTSCSSGTLSQTGTMYSHKFTAAGTFPYFCAAHCSAGMKGTITVQ